MSQCQYQKPLSRYAATYGVSYRTILRWSGKGYPLDDENATRALVAGQKNSPGDKSAPDSRTNAPRTLPSSATGALGLSGNIERLQEAEAAAHADYIAALRDGNDTQAAQRSKEWRALSEQLRKVEQSSPDIAEQNKKLIRADEVAGALTELLVTHRQDLENLGKRVAAELVGKDEISIREAIERETRLLIQSLYACEYLEVSSEQG